MRLLLDAFPLIDEVYEEYHHLRGLGNNRDQSVQGILSCYEAEMKDRDDSSAVLLGLAKGTAEKHEMTEQILFKSNEACSTLIEQYPALKPSIQAFCQTFCVDASIGPEASYRKRKIYKPDWQIGDTFLYSLQGDYAKKNCLEGWSVIVRKTDEYFSRDEKWYQLVYLSVAQPGFVPKTNDEMNELGYVPFQARMDGNSFVYKASIRCTSSAQLRKYELMKIGNFPNVLPPRNEISVPPHLAFPLLTNIVSKNGEIVSQNSFETRVVRNLQLYGSQAHI